MYGLFPWNTCRVQSLKESSLRTKLRSSSSPFHFWQKENLCVMNAKMAMMATIKLNETETTLNKCINGYEDDIAFANDFDINFDTESLNFDLNLIEADVNMLPRKTSFINKFKNTNRIKKRKNRKHWTIFRDKAKLSIKGNDGYYDYKTPKSILKNKVNDNFQHELTSIKKLDTIGFDDFMKNFETCETVRLTQENDLSNQRFIQLSHYYENF